MQEKAKGRVSLAGLRLQVASRCSAIGKLGAKVGRGLASEEVGGGFRAIYAACCRVHCRLPESCSSTSGCKMV